VYLQGTEHPKHLHGLGYPFEGMNSEILQGKRIPHQSCAHGTDHNRIGHGQSFQTGRNIDRFPGRQILVSAATAHLAHDYGSTMNAETYGQLYVLVSFQVRVKRRHDCVDNAQSGMQRTLRIVFMRNWPAKIDEQPITKILSNVPLILVDHLSSGGLIGAHYFTQIFRVELLRELG
jgi:hypothetical protein